jgi:phosphonate transport system substrate-binding protein
VNRGRGKRAQRAAIVGTDADCRVERFMRGARRTRGTVAPSMGIAMEPLAPRRRRRNPATMLRALCLLSLVAAACNGDAPIASSSSSPDTPPPSTPPTNAPTEIRVSFLPDDNVAAVERVAEPLSRYLTAATGLPIRYERAIDYQACVNGLASNRLDLVWLGGVTYCQALVRAIELVACRDIDLRFRSYFIANAELVSAGKLTAVDDLTQWRTNQREALAQLRFTFGAKDSTSGHIMPRWFLKQAGIDPETAFAGAPLYQLLGGHGATFRAVASGQVDLGVMNYATWEAQPTAEQAKTVVVHRSEPFVDYAFAAHTRLGAATIAQLRAALLALSPDVPEQQAILAAWKCQAFVAADPVRWQPMQRVLAELPQDFLK